MTFTLTIDTGNAAFEDAPLLEIARILVEQAARLECFRDQSEWSDILRDSNGNTVGRAELE